MNRQLFSSPIDLKKVTVTDPFWHREMELVRTEVIPYQWEALNDRVPGADPSWCMRNFRVAGRMMADQRRLGAQYTPPQYTNRGFQALPEDMARPEDDKFYGFLFQDSDFSKWIEAVGYSLTQHPDPELERIADEAIDVVCAAQNPDGYLDTYYIINGMDAALTNLRDNHELYCLGHLVEGAVAYYQATGKDKLLRAACRFVDFIDQRLGPEDGKCKGYPGHEIAEMALVRLYEVTGEEKYLRLSKYFVDQRGQAPNYFIEEERLRAEKEGRRWTKPSTNPDYHQAGKPVREQDEAVGHAVRAVYLYSGMADVARLTEDDSLLAACDRLWNNIVDKKLYVTGGIGATHHGEAFSYAYDLPNDTAYSETCAAIGLAFFARRMLQMKPDSKYADVMEMALYNTVLAGMALDGKSFFYVNPLAVVPEACRRDQRLGHVQPTRRKWFGCACCPPNIARIVASIASYAYTENEDTLFTHLYMGGTVEKDFHGRKLTMEVKARMPWHGHVYVTLHCDEAVNATLAFRIPAWAQDAVITCGEKMPVYQDGYAYLSGEWHEGDMITLHLPMQVRMLAANPAVRADVDKVAFRRGPVTFCAEQADNGDNLHLLRVDTRYIGDRGEGIEWAFDEDTFGHEIVKLHVPAKRLLPTEDTSLYTMWQPPKEEPAKITLVPYYTWANRGEGEMLVWLRRK